MKDLSTNFRAFLPAIAIVLIAVFFMGRYSKDDTSPELKAKWQRERETLTEAISQKDAQIVRLSARGNEIEAKRYSDSLYYARALERNQRAYNALKRKYNEINLNRADAHTLDSLLFSLYPNSR